MHLVKPDPLKEIFGLSELSLRLPGKSHDHVRGYRGMFVKFPQSLHRLIITLCIVAPVHPAKHGIASALQGKMEVGADLRQIADTCRKVLRHDPRLQRAKAYPLNPLNFGKPGKKAGQLTSPSVNPVGADMDAGQHDLPVTRRGHTPRLT